ncbi:hypothetical protein C8R44DRAFT_747035 [Mycena epipterygia]|nr:hypothetical protein C8R44DRAFT_747035 [Mycena epipterygia]
MARRKTPRRKHQVWRQTQHAVKEQNASPKKTPGHDTQPTQKHKSRARRDNTTLTRQPADAPNPQEVALRPNRTTLDPGRTSQHQTKKKSTHPHPSPPQLSANEARTGIACGARRKGSPTLARARGRHLPHPPSPRTGHALAIFPTSPHAWHNGRGRGAFGGAMAKFGWLSVRELRGKKGEVLGEGKGSEGKLRAGGERRNDAGI